MEIKEFQSWIWNWMQSTFGPPEEISKDRSMRFFEEAVELAQTTDLTREQAHELVDYVFERAPGNAHLEVGDVMLTLAGVASARGVDMGVAGIDVMVRAHANAEKIAAKRKLRPTDGSALPT